MEVFLECALDPLLTLLDPSNPEATGNLTAQEWRRRGEVSIHQPGSEGSVWARCDGRRAGTELPEPLFIFLDVFIPSSTTTSAPLVSFYNRGLSVPASRFSQVEQSCKTAKGGR